MSQTSKKPYVSRGEFERQNAAYGLALVHRETLGPGVDMFISEGRSGASEHMDVPHWVVTWALTRDERVEEAQVIRIPVYVSVIPSNVIAMPSRNEPTRRVDRIDIAAEAAKKWFKNSLKAGWA